MLVAALHAIEEHLKKGTPAFRLYVAKQTARTSQLARLAEGNGVKVSYVSHAKLDRIYSTGEHKGVLLELRAPDVEGIQTGRNDAFAFLPRIETRADSLVVALDGITDPHNFGAVLRTADLFSAECVVVQSHKSARKSSVVESVSTGASIWVRVVMQPNLGTALNLLKKRGYWIYGADVAGQSIEKTDLSGKTTLVLGSEGKGLRAGTRKQCDGLIRIPSSGHVDSFNVAVAAGILMYEIRRQQKYYFP